MLTLAVANWGPGGGAWMGWQALNRRLSINKNKTNRCVDTCAFIVVKLLCCE
jgi:hypothetical protein